MDEVCPPRPRLPTPSPSTHGHTTAPDRPKLRNSCHACASSKLKCSQEKPTCSRCAKRGLPCEYVAAKRGGRKPNSRSSISEGRGKDVSNTAVNVVDNTYLPSQANQVNPSSNSSTDLLRSPGVMDHPPKANVSGSSDVLHDFFGPLDQTLSSTSTSTGSDLDDFFTSPISFSTEMSDVNFLDTADFFPTGMNSSSNSCENLSDAFPLFEDTVSELFALSIPSSTPNNSTSSGKEGHNHQEDHTIESPCSCLVQALGFMKHLFPSPSNPCRDTQGLDKATIQVVITQNEATVEAMSTMLECSCSQNGYLLYVMSLIIFKVLGWYAAVARKTPTQPSSSRQSSPSEKGLQDSTVVGSYRLDGADSARMAAQLVLSELHRVRRLVDQLLIKLKVEAAKKEREARAETLECLDLDNEMTLPLSAVMYDQLDIDLRKRLKALSWEMIDRLRRL